MNSYWKKSMWFTPMQFNFATTPTITPDAGGSTGSGDGGAGGGSGGVPTGAGGGTGGAAASAPAAINWESAPQQFREGYNKLKTDLETLQKQYEPWKGLNVQPTEVQSFQQNYQQVYTEVRGMADALNITEAEVADAIKAHGLLPVLRQLEQEYQQAEAAAAGDKDAIDERSLEEKLNGIAERVLSPIQQRENQRITQEANLLTERTITQLASDAFKAGGMDFTAAPPELKDFILTGVTEVLKYDEGALKALKFEGKTAPIQKAFQTFTAMFDAAYLARQAMEGRRTTVPARPGQQRQQPPAGKVPGGLEEMISNPDSIRTAQNKPAYST